MAAAPFCVCGCRKSKHRKTRMSVMLKSNPKPIYPLPSIANISRRLPNASYHRMECRSCDCGDYLADAENP
jgi:hypothetical protein